MIRRGFWLTVGAVTGIYGYRRVSAISRRLSASLNPARPGVSVTQEATLARAARRGAIGLARETFRFTRDVREGMELYMARHSAPAGSTLGARDLEPARGPQANDKAHDQAHDKADGQINHYPRPKDGH